MRKLILLIIFIIGLAVPVQGSNLVIPEAPEFADQIMPQDPSSFGDGLWQLAVKCIEAIRPDLLEASRLCICVFCIVLICAIAEPGGEASARAGGLIGTVAIAGLMLKSSQTMIGLGANAVMEISEYGKLLLPVLTASLASQGGITSSSSLFLGTTAFGAVLNSIISSVMIPAIYIMLSFSVANSALGEDSLKKFSNMFKSGISWCLKILLTVFTTYMTVTGVVSGTTDAAALKTAKVTVSSVVPVVGGILSDASEAILVGAGVFKNAAGVYGILAILAIFLDPFVHIGCHYIMIKITAALCAGIGSKGLSELVDDFSSGMGLVLAMTGSVCLIFLISVVCFMKGVA